MTAATGRSRTILAVMLGAATLCHAPVVVQGGHRGEGGQRGPQGTSAVEGVVLIAEAAQVPARRAIVTLESETGSAQSVITDDSGRFAFTGLVAGRYGLRASRAGFVDAEYGAARPGRIGRRLSVGAGQVVRDVSLYMAPGAVITGRVTHDTGEPAPGVPILVFRPSQAPSLLASRDSRIVTDDQGAYRAFGLAPGRYFVAAVPASELGGEARAPASAEIDRIFQELRQRTNPPVMPANPTPEPARESPRKFTWAPLYHPGTPNRALAQVVDVGIGEERAGVDVALVAVPAAHVQGVVVNPGGPVEGIQVSIAGSMAPTPSSLNAPILTERPGPDGRFRYTNVPPGDYTLTARVLRPEPLFATAEVTVDGRDIDAVTLTLQPAMTFSGHAELVGDGPPPVDDLAKLRLSLQPPPGLGGSSSLNGTSFGRSFPAAGQFAADGTFEVRGILPGEYRPTVTLPSAGGWWLRSVIIGGRDVLDTPLIFRATSVTGAVLTFTNRRSQLSGRLLSSEGQPALDYHVVVVSADREHWLPRARRTRATRPDTEGGFVVSDLPAGSYLLVALDDLDPADLDDPAFLATLAPGGIPIEIADGASVVQDVRIAR
ncbi:MAG TPA: carboxypeptidase-like regulatory domain-containing protein [Vicinamibacterales bacterium]|nr:carboxypeptidase-like regulatory domain-containing protein [Vicinamibacterales bacterium]